MKKAITLLAATAALATSAQAAVVILDFGTTGASAVYTDGGNSYNRLNNAATTYSSVTAFDGSATTWDVTLTRTDAIGVDAQGVVWEGSPANAVAPFTNLSLTALEDGFYINNSRILTIAFTGLDDTKQYNLGAFGALDSGNSTPSSFSLTVGTATTGTATQLLDVDSNRINGVAAVWGLVTPTAGGNITFTVAADGGASGTRTELNAVRIEEVPEPSAAALLGLGGLALIRRRRA